jgi:hypothetical protein
MNKSILPISFAVILIGFGTTSLLFPYGVRSVFLRLTHGKGPPTFFSSQVIPSIRFGGFVGILMGAFVLWAVWSGQR